MESQPINQLTLMVNEPISLLLCLEVLNGGDATKEKDCVARWEGRSQKLLGYLSPPLTANHPSHPDSSFPTPPFDLPSSLWLGGSGSLGRWGLSSLVIVEVCVPLGMRAGKACFNHFRLPVSRKSVLWLWDCSVALG